MLTTLLAAVLSGCWLTDDELADAADAGACTEGGTDKGDAPAD